MTGTWTIADMTGLYQPEARPWHLERLSTRCGLIESLSLWTGMRAMVLLAGLLYGLSYLGLQRSGPDIDSVASPDEG